MCHRSWMHARAAARQARDPADLQDHTSAEDDDHITVIVEGPAETLGLKETPGDVRAAFDRDWVRAWIRLRAERVLSYAAEGASP